MCKTYKAFDNTIAKIVKLKENPLVKEYIEAMDLLKSQKDDLKDQIIAGNLQYSSNDYYTFYESTRISYDVSKVKNKFWNTSIEEKVNAAKLKKQIKDSGLDIKPEELWEVSKSVAVKCPIIK